MVDFIRFIEGREWEDLRFVFEIVRLVYCWVVVLDFVRVVFLVEVIVCIF